MWLTKSAAGFRAMLCPPNALVHFQFPFAHFHLSAIAVCLCFRDAFISQQPLWRPGGNIRAEAFRSSHGESGYTGHTVTGQVYTPTPLQNVNYLIRFAETASGRRKRVRGPVCGTRTSVRGSRRGRFWSVAPYRAVWSLILAADFALGRNSMWRGWEQNWTVLFSPPLFLSSTMFYLSLSHSLCTALSVNVADVLLSGRRERCLKRQYYGKEVFRAKLPG